MPVPFSMSQVSSLSSSSLMSGTDPNPVVESRQKPDYNLTPFPSLGKLILLVVKSSCLLTQNAIHSLYLLGLVLANVVLCFPRQRSLLSSPSIRVPVLTVGLSFCAFNYLAD